MCTYFCTDGCRFVAEKDQIDKFFRRPKASTSKPKSPAKAGTFKSKEFIQASDSSSSDSDSGAPSAKVKKEASPKVKVSVCFWPESTRI